MEHVSLLRKRALVNEPAAPKIHYVDVLKTSKFHFPLCLLCASVFQGTPQGTPQGYF